MVTDSERVQRNRTFFGQQVDELNEAYRSSASHPKSRFLKNRAAVALATVRAHLPPGARVLDVGAGPGYCAEILDGWGYRVSAVELLPEMTEPARQRANSVEWVHEPFREDLFPRGQFDAVLSLGYLEYQERAGKDLVRMARRLKPGGLLVLSVPNTLAGNFGFGLSRALYRWRKEPPETPCRHSFTPERLQRFLGMAGYILLDYLWLPAAEPWVPLSVERSRDLLNHRLTERLRPELLALARTYRPDDTAVRSASDSQVEPRVVGGSKALSPA